MSTNFNPAITTFNLTIPALFCIMSHFVASMLSESNTFLEYTKICQKDISSCHKICYGLVSNEFLFYCFLQCHICNEFAIGFLRICRPKREFHVLNLAKFWMVFIIWINKMLNFSHLEFPNSQQTLSWINFVSETKTNLCTCKWHFTVVEFIKPPEVQKDSLGCLWPQITM